jgi:hypothetical protein
MENKSKSRFFIFLLCLCVFSLAVFYYKASGFSGLDSMSTVHLDRVKPKTENTVNQTSIKTRANDSFNYIDKYANLLGCSVEYKLDSNTKHSNVTQLNSNVHDLRIVRGVLVYFPHDQFENFRLEFKWFYRSWIEMQKYEPAKWRTDIVVFFDGKKKLSSKTGLEFFEDLNCTYGNQRKNRDDPPQCVLIQYEALSDRSVQPSKFNFPNRDMMYEYFYDKFDIFDDSPSEFYARLKDISKYGYMDSILMAYDGFEYFNNSHYDFLIRSDMDVFLTPLFATWLPAECTEFVVGGGGYSAEFNMNRLRRVARNLNLKYAGIWNLGSTWYSTPKQFRLMGYLTLISMVYLSNEEFSAVERSGKLGVELV